MVSPEAGIDRLHKDLQTDDPIGRVIRAHLHVEQALNLFLDAVIPHSQYLKKMQLEFEQKCWLAVAHGFQVDLIRPVLSLGKIRNRMAHDLDVRFTKNETKNFYQSMSSQSKKIVQAAYTRTRHQLQSQLPERMTQLSHEDQFTLFVVTVRASLLAAVKEAEEAAN